MKAIVINGFGDPSVLTEAEIDEPVPGPGQVLVRVRAIGVNPVEAAIRSGAFGDVSFPAVLGFEFAGEVESIGEGVSDVRPSDPVAGWPDRGYGSYAEKTLSRSYTLIPDGVSFQDAAAALTAAETASRVLAQLDAAPGQTVLVHGASGAVGSVAVQLAAAARLHVIGTGSPTSLPYIRSLGATAVAYGDGLVDRVRAAAPHGVDAVFDAAGKGGLPASIQLRGGTERIITIADPQAQKYGVQFSYGNETSRNLAGVRDALQRLARGALTVRIAERLPLGDAARAHQQIETGHPGGKVLLLP